MQKQHTKRQARPAQHQQKQPGDEWRLKPLPVFYDIEQHNAKKLQGKVALITGGDSGIGRAVAVSFAQHGAQVAIVHLNESKDAIATKKFIEANTDQQCLIIKNDIQKESNCKALVAQVVKTFGKLDVLVNNAAVHYPQKSIINITAAQLQKTFATNVFSMFYLCKASLPHLKNGSSIINTASVTAYRGSGGIIDYAATKGAIVSFTRSLSGTLTEKGIRVNGVAPGPVWTPLISASFPPKHVKTFGSEVPLKRAGEPVEIAPCYVFLASDDASYMTGQILHPNGGEVVNG